MGTKSLACGVSPVPDRSAASASFAQTHFVRRAPPRGRAPKIMGGIESISSELSLSSSSTSLGKKKQSLLPAVVRETLCLMRSWSSPRRESSRERNVNGCGRFPKKRNRPGESLDLILERIFKNIFEFKNKINLSL